MLQERQEGADVGSKDGPAFGVDMTDGMGKRRGCLAGCLLKDPLLTFTVIGKPCIWTFVDFEPSAVAQCSLNVTATV